MSIINDGHYFPGTGGIPTDGLNEPLTIEQDCRLPKRDMFFLQSFQYVEFKCRAVTSNFPGCPVKATQWLTVDLWRPKCAAVLVIPPWPGR
ncbi:hypothetical protein QF56_002413 [Salmonella enterica subsp. enterica]|nr:hypothetical protein [Salmonella enterica subsp. enterica serovar Miami]